MNVVYATESDRVIDGVLGGLDDHVAYRLGDASDETRKGVKRGPVGEWTFGGLSGKACTAQEPRVTIRLRTTRVISTKTEGCVSAITYLGGEAHARAQQGDRPTAGHSAEKARPRWNQSAPTICAVMKRALRSPRVERS